MSSGVRMPLSATATTPLGSDSPIRSSTSRSTDSVRRLRLLTPMMSAPASTALASSAESCTSTRRRQPEPGGANRERAQLAIVERADDQQHGVGTVPGRFDELILTDDEVLSQNRDRDCRSDLGEVIETAVEECRLRQHGNRRRPAARIRGRVRGRSVVAAQDAPGRRPALAFCDDPRRRRTCQRIPEGLAFRAPHRLSLQPLERHGAPSRLNRVTGRRNNRLEQIRCARHSAGRRRGHRHHAASGAVFDSSMS